MCEFYFVLFRNLCAGGGGGGRGRYAVRASPLKSDKQPKILFIVFCFWKRALFLLFFLIFSASLQMPNKLR